jgi:hypothetical protein
VGSNVEKSVFIRLQNTKPRTEFEVIAHHQKKEPAEIGSAGFPLDPIHHSGQNSPRRHVSKAERLSLRTKVRAAVVVGRWTVSRIPHRSAERLLCVAVAGRNAGVATTISAESCTGRSDLWAWREYWPLAAATLLAAAALLAATARLRATHRHATAAAHRAERVVLATATHGFTAAAATVTPPMFKKGRGLGRGQTQKG